jgi:regulator of nucleoside diphosphate kinase
MRQDGIKMREPFILLCPEITRDNAYELIRWLEDKEVRRYLSDSDDVSAGIARVLDRVHLPVLTHIFNQDGRFFIACDKHNVPVGFVRLVIKSAETEMVVVIGDRSNWGRRLGASAIHESLKIAFFELRSPRVVAKIHKENERSIRAFTGAGFSLKQESGAFKCFAITMQEYLALVQRRLTAPGEIIITPIDKARLGELIISHEDGAKESLLALDREINRAKVIDMTRISPDVVTMNSRVRLQLNGKEAVVSLVYPIDANPEAQRMSVLSPVGTAILGYSEGDSIRWETPAGVDAIRIDRILYQPEAAGDYHL